MMWSRLFSWLARSTPRSSRRWKLVPQRHRLRVEILEDRTVLSVITVMNTNDTGSGSLRAAISQAVDNDSIIFAPSVQGTIKLASVLPSISQSITITGPGAAVLSISGENTVGIFSIIGAGKIVNITDLSIIKAGPSVRAININGNNTTLTLFNDIVSQNNGGGGINNNASDTLTVDHSAITGNQITASDGGGILNFGVLTVKNSTIAANTADTNTGGGICDAGGSSLNLVNSTVVGNQAHMGGGIFIQAPPASVNLLNGIIAGNTVSTGGSDRDFSDPLLGSAMINASNTFLGFKDGSTGIDNNVNGNIVGLGSPMLSPLGDHGGPTPTMVPLAGSPVIDKGLDDPRVGSTDQRGFKRIVGMHVDIGAAEYQPPGNMTAVTSSQNPSVFGQAVIFTAIVTPTAPGPNNTPTGMVNFIIDGGTPVSQTLDVSGKATLSRSDLAVGPHTVVVNYLGDVNFTDHTSGTLTPNQTVNKADTTTAVSSSANPSVLGQAVTFTAQVSAVAPGAGIPGGTVNFVIDGGAPVAQTLDASGKATLMRADLTIGNHTVVANYLGNGNFNISSGMLAGGQQVKAATTTAVMSSANPAVFGQAVIFTATVTSANGTPVGTVNFVIDGGAPVAQTLDANGKATLTRSDLAVGTHTVVANYLGNATFNASSGTLTGGQTVNKANTATAVSSSANPSVFGQAVMFTAQVSAVAPGAGIPGGMVNFVIDGGAPVAQTLDASGKATLSRTDLTVGAHTVVVNYLGNATFNASSGTLTGGQTVNKANTATAVSASPNPSVFGQAVMFTAQVTAVAPGAGIPGGMVNFVIDGGAPVAQTLDASGKATLSRTDLTVGAHTVVANYLGNGNFNISSGTLTPNQTVNKADTTTAVTSSVNPSVLGQAVTFTAQVSAVAPGVGVPGGTVNFVIDGGAPVAQTLDASGKATLMRADLTIGNHTVVANYLGNGNFNISSGTLAGGQQVKAATTTAVMSSANPAVFGQAVIFTATVTSANGTPVGTVNFVIDGGAPVAQTLDANGKATLTRSDLAVGSHTVVANYLGNATFNASSGTLTGGQTVNKANTATAVSSSANPSVFGQAVIFTAQVSAVAPGAGIPGGMVNFVIDGGAPVAQTLDASGKATLSRTDLTVGAHTVVVNYLGNGNFNISSGTLTGGQTVNKANTATAVSSSANPSVFGQAVMFTAQVSAVAPGAGIPGGTVNFVIDGGAPVAQTLDASGKATLSRTDLTVGAHTVVANYLGNGNFNISSGTLTPNQTVNKADTTTAVSSSINPSVLGQAVTFTAQVSAVAPGAGIPGGTVNFVIDGGAPVAQTLDASGKATLMRADLTIGNHTVVANYLGNGNFNTSSGTLAGGQQVKAATTTTVMSSANPAVFGQAVLFTATVTSANGTPVGTVNFVIDGGTPVAQTLDANGKATLTRSDLAVGTHTVVANYLGNATFNASSGTLTGGQTVNKANTATAVSSSANPSVFGQAVIFTAQVTAVAPGAGIPGGMVNFVIDGGAPVAQTLDASGKATLSRTDLTVGAHTVVANYLGNGNFNISSGTLTPNQTVNKADTTTAVTSSVNPSVLGQVVTFTAQVSAVAPGAGIPGGTVNFVIDGGAPVAQTLDASGKATLMRADLTIGNHTVVANYLGNGNFNTSSGTLAGGQQVKANTTTAVSSSVNPSVFGQAVIFTATVTSASGTPAGTVNFVIDGGNPVAQTLDANGKATLTRSDLAVGSHTVVANYLGNATFNTSSGILTGGQTVTKANTTTAVSSSVNPSAFGQAVIFTAQVNAASPGAGIPAGTVNFVIDGGAPVAATMDATGKATLTRSDLAVGSHTVVANYQGDSNFNTSSGTLAGGQTVNQAATSTAVNSSVNPSVFGQAVIFTATVTSAGGTPGGTVNFVIDGGNPVAQTLDATGKATLTRSDLTAGSHTVVANYLGNAGFNASSGTLANGQTVNKAGTTTTVSSSAISSVFGQTVTFTATIGVLAPGAGTPSGSVDFIFDNGTATRMTLTNGSATLQRSDLTVGSHTLTVNYIGDSNFAPSTGNLTPNQQVSQAATTVSVSAAPAQTTFGQQVTFTAVVKAVNGTPTGNVNFLVDGTSVTKPVDATGTATYQVSTLTGGNHAVIVNYLGDANFSTSVGSLPGGYTVNKANTGATITSALNPSTFGQAVTFLVTLTAQAPGSGTPGGTVNFVIDGGSPVGQTVTNGQATLTLSNLTGGSHTIVANYLGDTNFNATSVTLSAPQQVNTAATTLQLSSSPSSPTIGQSLTLTATVTITGTPPLGPTGTVTFFDNGTQLGSPVTLSGTTATFTVASLSAGTHTYTANYSGDTNFQASTGTLPNRIVPQIPTTVAMTAAPNPAKNGQTITLTATLTIGGSTSLTPSGTVTFLDNGTAIGSPATLSGTQATLTTSSLTPGRHSITAQYSGDANFAVATSPAVLQVVRNGAIFAIGGGGRVQVRRTSDGSLIADFTPYGASYKGSISVAVGDVNGDGFEDLILGANGSPHLKVYDGKSFTNGSFNPANPDASQMASFMTFDPKYHVGISVAAGYVTGNGFADIIVGATSGNPHVKVYNGLAIASGAAATNSESAVTASFFAYALNQNIGVNVAAGDVTHSGFADVVTAATSGGGQVKVYNGQTIANGTFNGEASLRTQFTAFPGITIGAFVAVGDTTGQGFGNIIVGAASSSANVKVYSGKGLTSGVQAGNPDANLLDQFFAYETRFNTGTSVAAGDFESNGMFDILTGATGAAHYRVVRANSSGIMPPAVNGIDAIASDIQGGITGGA